MPAIQELEVAYAGARDDPVFQAELGQLLRFRRDERNGFLDEHVFAGFEEEAAQIEVRLRRCRDHYCIDARHEIFVVGRKTGFGDAKFARSLQVFRLEIAHEQFHRQ